jgi:hypothetical protein
VTTATSSATGREKQTGDLEFVGYLVELDASPVFIP